MYLIEGPSAGFTSIPQSMYWAIVTLTTVGYGDIAPQSPLGQALAALVMIMGYGIIAVPTGIVTVELAEAGRASRSKCAGCAAEGHAMDARFCRRCGEPLTFA
jgi:voltage-gated potassium channel